MHTYLDSIRNRFIPSAAWLVAVMALLAADATIGQAPDTFTWKGGASGSWDADGVWTPAATSRTFPEIAGDLVVTTNAATIALAQTSRCPESRSAGET